MSFHRQEVILIFFAVPKQRFERGIGLVTNRFISQTQYMSNLQSGAASTRENPASTFQSFQSSQHMRIGLLPDRKWELYRRQ